MIGGGHVDDVLDTLSEEQHHVLVVPLTQRSLAEDRDLLVYLQRS